MAGEETGTSTTGTSTKGTDGRGTEAVVPSSATKSPPHTKTSMTTAAPPLEERPARPLKYKFWIIHKIDVFKLAGCLLDPEKELAAASRLWGQCNIAFEGIFHKPYDEATTRGFIGAGPAGGTGVQELTVMVHPDEPTASMHKLRREWRTRGRAKTAVFFAPKVFLMTDGAPSCIDPVERIVYLGAPTGSAGWDLAHELGHLLIAPGHIYLKSSLMRPSRPGNEIVDLECRAARGDPEAQARISQLRQKAYE